jgi:hypothetical protein
MKLYKFCIECGQLHTKLSIGDACQCLKRGRICGLKLTSDKMVSLFDARIIKYGGTFILNNVLKNSGAPIVMENNIYTVGPPPIRDDAEFISDKWGGRSPVRR